MMKLKCFFYGFSYLSVKHRNRWYCLLLFLLVVSQCYLEWVNNLKSPDHGFIVTETCYLPGIAVGLFFSCTVKVNSSYMMPLVNRFIGGTIPLGVIPLFLDWNIKSFMRIGYISVTLSHNSLQDIELSKEINESFKQSPQARTKLPSGIEMSVHVLTTGYVGYYNLQPCVLVSRNIWSYCCLGTSFYILDVLQVLANVSTHGRTAPSWTQCVSGFWKSWLLTAYFSWNPSVTWPYNISSLLLAGYL